MIIVWRHDPPEIAGRCQRRTSFRRTMALCLSAAPLRRAEREAMFAHQIAAAIEAAPVRALDTLSRSIWQGLAGGALTDDDAQRLAELIHARRTAAREAPARPVQRRVGFPLAATMPTPPAGVGQYQTRAE